MRNWFKYLICVVMGAVLFSSCIRKRVFRPSLKENYNYVNKDPFGGYMTYEGLSKYFHAYPTILDPDFPLGNVWDSSANETKSLYFILTNSFIPYKKEQQDLLSYVRNGNDLFISANEFDVDFLKELDVAMDAGHWLQKLSEGWGNMKETQVSIALGKNMPDIPFKVFYYPFLNHFVHSKKDMEILGKNEIDKPNFIVLFLGKGKIYLHFAPRALGNYFLLTRNNANYLNYVLNFIDNKPDNVYWDEIYSKDRPAEDDKEDFKSLRVIMEQPALKWAFFLGLIGFMAFLFSSMIRRQRAIPIRLPEANTSVDFSETVARLYYVHKDNKNIASKLITYFYENIRRKYLLAPSGSREDFALRLSGKRNWPLEDVNELLEVIEAIKVQDAVSDEQLIHLNDLLEKFYKPQ